MTVGSTITTIGENGEGFILKAENRTSYGDLRIVLNFELHWTKGQIDFISSEKKFQELQRSIFGLNNSESAIFDYISDEGNVEIIVKPTGFGDAIISVIAITNMSIDNRVEFELRGTISVNPAQ